MASIKYRNGNSWHDVVITADINIEHQINDTESLNAVSAKAVVDYVDSVIGQGGTPSDPGSGSSITVDQTVTANSENPASSKAVIKYVGEQITGKFDAVGSADAAEGAANDYTDEQLANYSTTEQMNDAIASAIESTHEKINVLEEIASAESVDAKTLKIRKDSGAIAVNITKNDILEVADLPATEITEERTVTILSSDRINAPVSNYFSAGENQITRIFHGTTKVSNFTIPDNGYVYSINYITGELKRYLEFVLKTEQRMIDTGGCTFSLDVDIVITPATTLASNPSIVGNTCNNVPINATTISRYLQPNIVIYKDTNNTTVIPAGGVIPAGTYNVFVKYGVKIVNNNPINLGEGHDFSGFSISVFKVTTEKLKLVPDLNRCDISSDKFRYMIDKNKYVEASDNGVFTCKNTNKKIEVNNDYALIQSNGAAICLNNNGKIYINFNYNVATGNLDDTNMYRIRPVKQNEMIYLILDTNDYVETPEF